MVLLREAHFRHATHYETVLRAANQIYLQGGGNVKHGLSMFDLEWNNIKAAQAWTNEHVDEDDAAMLCNKFPEAGLFLLLLRLHPNERVRWLEPALVAARSLKQRYNEGRHLNSLGLAYADLDHLSLPIEMYEQSLSIAREIGNQRGEANVLQRFSVE